MRFIRTLGFIAIMAALGTGGSLLAQDANPPGAYQQSCSGISVKKGTLYAKCQDDKGKGHSTKLADYQKCGSAIMNKNGSLACGNDGGAKNESSATPSQPTGSYTDTCRDIRMKGNTLHAICKSLDGHEAPTSLREANRCSDGVANLNGILSCDVSDVLPPGSYISTCKDVHMKGTTLYASCDNGKNRWLNAELHEAHRCNGDIVNQNGALRCTPIKTMERR